MKQREVQDEGNVTWTCVQAFAGVSGRSARKAADAAEKLTATEGTVAVVCTPSGGAKSVRLELPRDWPERTSDDALLAAIAAARAAE
jgi:hypothetical protein